MYIPVYLYLYLYSSQASVLFEESKEKEIACFRKDQGKQQPLKLHIHQNGSVDCLLKVKACLSSDTV